MGCSSSSNTTVHPLTEAKEDEAGCKPSRRGDSAGSKGTTDSGVVIENKDLLALPGSVPDKLPPLSSESLRECEVDGAAPNDAMPSLPQGGIPVQGRPKSCEILEELWSQGIIPVGQRREKDSGAAFIIMDESRRAIRRLPARLDSLKVKKVPNHSREEFEEKMRLAEERRKLRQNEKKKRLRTNTAQGHRPASVCSVEEAAGSTLSPVEALQLPTVSQPSPVPALQSHIPHKAAMGGELVKEAVGDKGERPEEKHNGEKRRKGTEEVGEHNQEEGGMEEEGVTQVEELRPDELLAASEQLESDFSFQHGEDKDEIF